MKPKIFALITRSGIPHLALALAIALSASACRLGANNGEKLSALKSGEIYDEDGLLAVAIETPAADTLINRLNDSASFEVAGTCQPDNSAVTLAVDESDLSAQATCSGGKWSISIDTTALTSEHHSLVATLTNSNGKSKDSAAVSFNKDTRLVSLAITSPGGGSYVSSSSNSASFAVSGTCGEANRPVTLTVDGASASGFNASDCNGATWSATFSTLSLSAGAHTLVASMTSAAGNSSSSDPIVVTKDTTAPSVAISAPAANAYVNLGNNSASFAASGTCNDSSASVQFKVDGANSGSAAACNGSAWNTTFSTVGLSQGTHTLSAVISDPAGNSATSATVSITQDTTAPTISISAPTANSYIHQGNSSASFAISGSCSATENGRSITVKVDGASATQSAITCGGGGTWSGTIDTTTPIPEGSHTLSAVLQDVAGNSTTSATVAVTKDVTPPTVEITRPIANSTIQAHNNGTAYVVSGTCTEAGRSVTVKVDGTASGSGGTCASSAWTASINTTGLASGAHTILATMTDAASNSDDSSSIAITKDLTKPGLSTFTRGSVARDPYTLVQSSSGKMRFPRIGGATGGQIEESTDNLFWNSQAIDDSTYWTHSQVTVSANAAVAPDGTMTADKVIPNTTDAVQHRIGRASPITDGTTGTISVYAKAAGYDFLALYTNSTFGSTSTIFDLANGTITGTGGGSTATITSVGNGWYRLTARSTSHGTVLFMVRPDSSTVTFAGDGTKGVLLWGAQAEAKPYATSYVETAGATAARASEYLAVPTAGVINAAEGAIVMRVYFDGDIAAATSQSTHFLFDTTPSSGSRLTLQVNNSTPPQLISNTFNSSGQTSSTDYIAQLSTGWHLVGIRWKPGRHSLWVDGQEKPAHTSPKLPVAFGSTFAIGSIYHGGSGHLDQPVDYFASYLHAPNDTDMAAYTTTGPTQADYRLDFNGANFSRALAATEYGSTSAQVAAGAPRFATVANKTGIWLEAGTTNLLTANSSSFETDLTGVAGVTNGASTGTASGNTNVASGATVTRDTTKAWAGSASLRVDPTAQYHGMIVGASGLGTNTTYAISAWVWAPTGQRVYQVPRDTTNGVSGSWSEITGNGQWQRLTSTITMGATNNSNVQQQIATRDQGLGSFYVDGLQIEQKPYATSWTVGGSTRPNDVFSVPLANNLPTSDWTIELAWIPLQPLLSFISQAHSPVIFQIGDYYTNSSIEFWTFFENSSGAEPHLRLYLKGQTSAGWSSVATQKATGTNWYTPGAVHRFAVRATGNNSFVVFFNGNRFPSTGSYTISDPVTSWGGSNFYLGDNANAVYDELRISSTARSDADLLSYTAGTTGLSWDANTTVHFDFSSSLSQ